MKKMAIAGLLAIMLVGMVFSTGVVSAYRGDYTVKGPNYTAERHEAMEKAFASLDYTAWQGLMTADGRHPRVVDVVTESNFETFVRAHEAGENGDYETAAELRAELGLNNGNGPKDGTGYGKGQGQGKKMRQNSSEGMDHGENQGAGQGKGRQ